MLRYAIGSAAFETLDRARHLKRRLQGARPRHVSTRQGTIHALDVDGDGRLPTVVLLHGLSSSAVDFGGLVRHLRPHVRRVIALDSPGHGRSAVPRGRMRARAIEDGLFEAIVSMLDEPAIVYGSSLGGMLATRFAGRHPDSTTSLVLVSPAGAPSDPATLTGLKRRFRLDDRDAARGFIRDVFVRRRWYDSALAWAVQRRMAARPIRQLLAATTAADFLAAEELSSLTMPVLLLWGRQESVLPDGHYEFFARHLPVHAERRRPDRFGHAPHVDYPERVARHIIDFVR